MSSLQSKQSRYPTPLAAHTILWTHRQLASRQCLTGMGLSHMPLEVIKPIEARLGLLTVIDGAVVRTLSYSMAAGLMTAEIFTTCKCFGAV